MSTSGRMFEETKARFRRFGFYRGLRFAWHFATDPKFRRDQIMRVRRPGNLFQYRSLTRPNRYPMIFSFLRERLADVREPRLLSFGCATGEEVLTLRDYFPHAELKGIDISAGNIAACQARLAKTRDAKIAFSQRDSAAAEAEDSYDAICCLAVLQHQSLQDPKIQSCENYITFEAFERTLAGLARCLKPGGYLALRHADFRFADSAVARDFTPVLWREASGQVHPCFDRNNRRLPDREDDAIVFQKRARG